MRIRSSAAVERPHPFDTIERVPEAHQAVDAELRNWGRWACSESRPDTTSPMFRLFRASHARGAYGAPTPAPAVESHKALRIERVVRELPELHRQVIRGWYVVQARPHQLCRVLGVRPDTLARLLDDGRSMVAAATGALRRGELVAAPVH